MAAYLDCENKPSDLSTTLFFFFVSDLLQPTTPLVIAIRALPLPACDTHQRILNMASIGDTDTTTTTRSLMDTPAEVRQEILLLLNEDYPCFVSPSDRSWASWWMPYLRGRPQIMSPELVALRDCCKELKSHIDTLFPANKDKTVTTVYTIKEIPEFKAGEVLPRSNWPLLPDDDGPILMPPPANLQSIRTLIMSLCPLPARSGLLDMGSSAAFHHTAPKLPQLRSITFARRLLVSVTGADFERKCSREGEAGLRIRCYMRFKGNADSTAYNLANSPGSQSVSQATAMQLFLTDYQVSFEETYLSEESGERLRVVYNASENVIESKIRYPGSMAL